MVLFEINSKVLPKLMLDLLIKIYKSGRRLRRIVSTTKSWNKAGGEKMMIWKTEIKISTTKTSKSGTKNRVSSKYP